MSIPWLRPWEKKLFSNHIFNHMSIMIARKFASLRAKGEKALITFITAGDPDLATTEKLVLEMDRLGVDIVELGVPFSDPIADGPTIQASSLRSLKAGTTLPRIINLVRNIRKKSNIPIVLMGYYNPFYVYGLKKFVRQASRAGIDGVIVPDLSPEEAGDLVSISRKFGLATIFLLAPTSTKERIKIVLEKTSGFIYYVSLTGVTGERKRLPPDLVKKLKKIRARSAIPLAVGFGISHPRQIKAILKNADAVIVGSALVKVIEESGKAKDLFQKFNRKLRLFLSAVKK